MTDRKHLNDIWKGAIHELNNKELNDLEQKNYSAFKAIKFSSDSAFYFADENKVLASIFSQEDISLSSFENRFKNVKGVSNDPELGNKLFSYGGEQKGQNWVFVVEYMKIGDPKQYHYFHTEVFQNPYVSTAIILTDPAYREQAIKLVNKFTKSLMNVTLDLKPAN